MSQLLGNPTHPGRPCANGVVSQFSDPDARRRFLEWRRLGCLASLTLLTLLGPGNLLAQATLLQRWQVDPTTQQLELWLAAGITPVVSLLQAPPRIVIDLPGVTIANSQTQTYMGTIRQVRLGQFQPDRARMVIELAAGTPLTKETVRLQRVADRASAGERWLLSPDLTAATRAHDLRPLNPPGLAAIASDHRPASAADRPPPIPPSLPAAGGPASPVNDELPPAQFLPPPGSQPVTVRVPSLTQPAPMGAASFQVPTMRASGATSPVTVPPAAPPTAAPPVATATPPVFVTPAPSTPLPSPLPPMPGAPTGPGLSALSVNPAPMTPAAPPTAWQPPASAPLSASASSPPTGNLIQFGQPLPMGQSAPTPGLGTLPSQPLAFQSPLSTDRLPVGTWLSLVYPGQAPLPLQNGVAHPAVLVLQQNLMDSRGNLFAPAGSRVLGRFESGRDGSRFVTQAIEINGTSQLLAATSLWMQGDRHVSKQKLWRNSGIAAAAGMVLTGFTGVGLLAGAAMGLAGTYAITPQPATIQPGQVIMVQVLEPVP